MTTVAEILRVKASQSVYSVPSAATVLDALKHMAEHNVGSVLVIDGDKLVGIFTERDYARKIVLLQRSSRDTPVREIMSSSVRYVTPEFTADQCMALMTENRLRHLPVMEGGKVIGLVSIGDLVASIISEQQFIIEQLEQYITS